jgi:hypothetical protein
MTLEIESLFPGLFLARKKTTLNNPQAMSGALVNAN